MWRGTELRTSSRTHSSVSASCPTVDGSCLDTLCLSFMIARCPPCQFMEGTGMTSLRSYMLEPIRVSEYAWATMLEPNGLRYRSCSCHCCDCCGSCRWCCCCCCRSSCCCCCCCCCSWPCSCCCSCWAFLLLRRLLRFMLSLLCVFAVIIVVVVAFFVQSLK